jgi:hypothetical protein
MSSSSAAAAAAAARAAAGSSSSSLYRPYHRSNSTGSSSSSIENLPPRTLARVSKEVRELIKNPPEGIRLVVDSETGLPASLGEIMVRGSSVPSRIVVSLTFGSAVVLFDDGCLSSVFSWLMMSLEILLFIFMWSVLNFEMEFVSKISNSH